MAVWVVRGGSSGEFEARALDEGVVIEGSTLGDLSNVLSLDEVKALYKQVHPDQAPSVLGRWANEMYDFRHTMADGDLVVMPLKTSESVAIGRVTGGAYDYRSELIGGRHTRTVRWIRKDAARSSLRDDLLRALAIRRTVYRLEVGDAEQRLHAVYSGRPDPGPGLPPTHSVWAFQGDPDLVRGWPWLASLKPGDLSWWLVTAHRSEMKPGDQVVIWRSGRQAGAVALAELISEPHQKRPADVPETDTDGYWVDLRYTHVFGDSVPKARLVADPVLREMIIVKGSRGTNFRVQPAEWNALMKLIVPPLRAAFASAGLSYTDLQLATFVTALQTKGFVILSGISGTGKSKIAQRLAKLLPGDGTHLFLPVRPDWRDGKPLLGYYNPLSRTYQSTPFLAFLQIAKANWDGPPDQRVAFLVILDEMNLARVEYYFANLLSVLESGRDADGLTVEALTFGTVEDDPEVEPPPPDLKLPPNLYIVGTVNVDETTHGFSPKVLDRAFTIELTEADFANYKPGAAGGVAEPDDPTRAGILHLLSGDGRWAVVRKGDVAEALENHPELRDRLQDLNLRLREHDLHFGYRVFDEICAFVGWAEGNGLWADLGGWEAAFDAAVLMKVLPKFHGSRAKLEAPLEAIVAWCGVAMPQTRARVERMQRDLKDGFASFS